MSVRALVVLLVLAPAVTAADPPQKDPSKAPPPTAVDPKAVPPDLADWTPRPAVGKAEPWERATDKDWVDGRFIETDTGPFLNATFGHWVGNAVMVYKGTAVRLNPAPETSPNTTPAVPGASKPLPVSMRAAAAAVFDRNTLRWTAGWTGGYLGHGNRRFGLLNTPRPLGQQIFFLPAGPGWASLEGKWDAAVKRHTAPLPAEWAMYRGLHVHGNRVVFRYTVGKTEVLDAARFEVLTGHPALIRTLSVGPREQALRVAVPTGTTVGGAVLSATGTEVEIPAGNDTKTVTILYARSRTPAAAEDVNELTKPGPARWGKPLVTDLAPGDEAGPFAVDTLTLPYDNPFKALFFCTGLDHLPDGRVAVCTCHGDVWLARIDEAARKVHWQRFATGLYHPLGLKVIDGKVVVLERGQLTRLHDENADGEADFYECVNNDWHTGGGEHSYDTCLETDPAGNFYFFKTGDTETLHGGCLLKVSKDGSKCETVCTGFRHPIGLGMSPTGIVTGADQEGNWMPATRIDQYKPGGFYGDMRTHHRKDPPKLYDGPLCWLPREVDNSAGGQVWVPADSKWPLAGLPIHFSYGRCKAFVLLRQELPGGTVQGGVADLHVQFLSGVCRGRFHPTDGHLYVCGLNGWQTGAKADGCVQRVRYTGKPLDVPVKMEVVADGVKLTFSRPLDRAKAADPANFRAAWWNYKWSGEYGSKRYKVSGLSAVQTNTLFPKALLFGGEGQDDVPVTGADVSADGRTVFVKVGPVKPVMQMQVGFNVAAADGKKVVGSVYLTVHQAR